MHLIPTHKEDGLNPYRLVGERLEQDPRALEPGPRLRHQCHTRFIGGEVSSFKDRSGFVKIAKIVTDTTQVASNAIIKGRVRGTGHPIEPFVCSFLCRNAHLVSKGMTIRDAKAETFVEDRRDIEIPIEDGNHTESDLHFA